MDTKFHSSNITHSAYKFFSSAMYLRFAKQLKIYVALKYEYEILIHFEIGMIPKVSHKFL